MDIAASEKSNNLQNNRFFKLYGFLLAALFSTILVMGVISPELTVFLIQEDGPVESLSAAGYFLCAVLVMVLWGQKAAGHWQFIIVLLAFGLRELDFNSRLTAMSVTKIKFFTSPDIPIIQKIFAVVCGLLILYCLTHILIRYYRSFLISLKKLEPHVICIATGLVFLLASLALDGAGRKLLSIGIAVDKSWLGWAESAEEMLELGIPVMFILGVRTYWAEKMSPVIQISNASQENIQESPALENNGSITSGDEAPLTPIANVPGQPYSHHNETSH
jgi:hypothetical protein